MNREMGRKTVLGLVIPMIIVGLVGVLMDKGIGILLGSLTPWLKNESRK